MNTISRKISELARSSIWFYLILFIGIALMVSDCTPDPMAQVGSGYEVEELEQDTWASISSLVDLDPLSVGDAPLDVLTNGWVTTDTNGKARLHKDNYCAAVYVFYNSGIKISGDCSQNAGNWSCVVGAAVSQGCSISLATPPATVHPRGTWYSVITLDNANLVLVTVLDGEAEVVPVVAFENRLAMPEGGKPVLLEVINPKEDPAQAIVLKANQSTYTASDAYLDQLRQRVELPPARQPLDPPAFQVLVERLVDLYPGLADYINEIRGQAREDALPFPIEGQGQGQPAVQLALQGAGGFLEEPAFQTVLLNGINWQAVQAAVFPRQEVNISFDLPGQSGLLAEQPFLLEQARAQVDQNALARQRPILLIPQDDPELQALAAQVLEGFQSMGMKTEISVVPDGEIQSKFKTSIAAGMPVVMMTRR